MTSKLKFFDKPSSSSSPLKGNKYKNFLTSVLSPVGQKRNAKKKLNKSQKSEQNTKSFEEKGKSLESSEKLADSTYSTIKNLHLKEIHNLESDLESTPTLSSKESNLHYDVSSAKIAVQDLELSSLNDAEPLYATVSKQKKNQRVEIRMPERQEFTQDDETDSKDSYEQTLKFSTSRETDASLKSIIEGQKEEIKILQERMKEISEEKRLLQKDVHSLLKEEKWKQDSLHAQLKLRITELETETHKEVGCLTERIQALVKERELLTSQVHTLHQDKKALQIKYDEACHKAKAMMSPELLQKANKQHEKILSEIKRKHSEELAKLKSEVNIIEESKASLMVEVQDLQEKVNFLKAKNEALQISEKELLKEKNRILIHLEEAKQMGEEAQNMLLTLLKVTENVALERDILLNKASFQDHQQKKIQTTIVDYSLNVGRLQEHISNLSREKSDELQRIKVREYHHDENLKQLYGQQLDILRSKVLNQNSTINELETEKTKLELQLDSIWQATCGKPKLLEDVNNITFLNI